MVRATGNLHIIINAMNRLPASPPDPEVAADALAAAREAAFLSPNDAGTHARLGRAALAADRLPDAIEALQRAVRLDPDDAAARVDLGRAWLAAAEAEKAAFHLRRAVALDPGDTLGARALVAAAEAGAAELSPVFVRNLFDQYAERYDAEMTGTLAYRAPEALHDLFARIAGAPANTLDILDLGCGTGLSGRAFRAFARTLVGVDLSPAMAAKARARGIYDRVIVGDMTRACARGAHDVAALGETPAAFDLVVAADVLGYVGDLAPVFSSVRVTLRRPGWFAATVEENPDAPPGSSTRGFAFAPTRRFRHGAAYVRRAAQAAGFGVLALEPTELRRDRGQPVAGLAFILGG